MSDPVRTRGTGAIFVMTAPSGAGKSTLVRRVLDSLGGLRFCVSHTTRPRRRGEEEGRDYHFVDQERFEKMRDGGAFLEWAVVHGGHYGTARETLQEILDAGEDALLDLDVQGAAALRRQHDSAILIYVMPPEFAELRRRLEGRGTRGEELDRRLRAAAREVREAEGFNYLVVNDTLDDACALIEAIVLAERCRPSRRRTVLERIAATFPAGETGGDGRDEEG